jgi:hypothetical protein
MADQDFQINIRTIADTTGIRLTQQQLGALQTAAIQGNQRAITALNQLKSAANEVASSFGFGFSGAALGIGAAVTGVGILIRKIVEFNAEQDRMIEKMIQAQEKQRELGNAIIETQDKLISQRRTGVEPLEQSYVRLSQELVNLKTQQSLLNLPSQAEEWKKLQEQIQDVENQIKGVTDKLGGVPPPPTIAGPKAKKGESQALVDEIERNRKAAEEQLKEDVWEFDPETGGMRLTGQKRFPIFQPTPAPIANPPPNENMIASPVADATLERIAAGIETLLTLWR